jgi:hypothetical protein
MYHEGKRAMALHASDTRARGRGEEPTVQRQRVPSVAAIGYNSDSDDLLTSELPSRGRPASRAQHSRDSSRMSVSPAHSTQTAAAATAAATAATGSVATGDSNNTVIASESAYAHSSNSQLLQTAVLVRRYPQLCALLSITAQTELQPQPRPMTWLLRMVSLLT